MKPLVIDATEFTPKALFDPSTDTFEIVGESRPEDANQFYFPILDWLDEYSDNRQWEKSNSGKETAEMKFYFEYFNSTSAKFIMDILMKIAELRENGMDISIKWCYDEMDTDMKDTGEEMEDLACIPFVYEVVE